mgnify:CR=1 FL=1
MEFKTFVFYFLAVIMVAAALRVITARNPVHAALFLVLTFFNAGGLWLLLQAEFLAITLVMVYVGAVMVLFLFVVMMLDINMDSVRQGFWKHFPLAALIGGVVAAELIAVLWAGFPGIATEATPIAADVSNTRELGKLLYTEYLYPVEIAAVILLVAMSAAIALTLRQRKDSKAINPSLQVRVRASDRLEVVKVAATQKAQPEVPAEPAAEEKKA